MISAFSFDAEIYEPILTILVFLLLITQKRKSNGSQNHWLSFLLIFSLILNIAHCSDLNVTATSTSIPGSTTTQFFTTTSFPTGPTTASPTNTFSPTLEPTPTPTGRPTATPSTTTTEHIPSGQSSLNQVSVTCRGPQVNRDWVTARKAMFIAMFKSAFGAYSEYIKVVIGKIIEIFETYGDDGRRRRGLLSGEVVGVTIEYLVAIDDPITLNTFRDEISSGSFSDNFEEEIDDNFDGIDVDDDIVIIDKGTGDADEFLGEQEPTFGEMISSPFILLGIVCTIVGIIWLLFLRSTIENKYPSYLLAAIAGSAGGDAVEMVPQTSAGGNEQKQKNQKELQQAWNESDAEAES